VKKIFIIGASGFIGNYLFRKFLIGGWEATGSYFRHFDNGLIPLDITDITNLYRTLEKNMPDVVCLPAAIPNVEYCEEHVAETEKVNIEGTKNVAFVCRDIGAKLVYFSSDYIFDGKDGPYKEDDIPNPLSVYGRQKLVSEGVVKETLENYIIARTTVVYGYEARGKNFIERLLLTLRQKREISVPIDQIGSPTYVVNLAEMIFALVEKNVTGIFNVCGSEVMNRYNFAYLAAKSFGLDTSLIIPVTTETLRQKALRPLKAGMNTEKVSSVIPVKPIGISEGLKKLHELMDVRQ